MKNFLYALAAVAATAGLLVRCNPQCETLTDPRIHSQLAPQGYELLITANPLEALRNRRVFFGQEEATETRFEPGLGLIAKVPFGAPGTAQITIQDADCGDVSVPMSFVRVGDPAQAFNLPGMVFPLAPEIIVPTPPINLPPSIDNAWFQPDNAEYCIWFKTVKDTMQNGTVKEYNILDSRASAELSTCGSATTLYSGNPVVGIFDKANNYIRFTIDRTSKGLGYEEFEGQLINYSLTPYKDKTQLVANCGTFNPTLNSGGYAMLVVSRSTGRYLVLVH